jgi:hypothetical protein
MSCGDAGAGMRPEILDLQAPTDVSERKTLGPSETRHLVASEDKLGAAGHGHTFAKKDGRRNCLLGSEVPRRMQEAAMSELASEKNERGRERCDPVCHAAVRMPYDTCMCAASHAGTFHRGLDEM